jgi:hypothetical protein
VVGKTPFYCDSSALSGEDDFKKALHDTIFNNVKSWSDSESEETLFGDRGKRELFDGEGGGVYKECVKGLMRREPRDRMEVETVVEMLGGSV